MARRKKAVPATIADEILQALPKVKQKAKEKTQAFRLRVVKALAKIDEDDWDKLSEEAQDWYDEAAEAANEGEPLPDFPTAESDEDEEDEEEEEEEDEDEEDEDEEDESLELDDLDKGDFVTAETEDDEFTGEVKSTLRGTLTLDVDGDKVKLKDADLTWISRAEKPEPKKKGRGRTSKASAPKEKKKTVGQHINEICAKFPGLDVDKVNARLEKAGVECSESALRTYYRQAHAVIDVLKAEGWKKGK